MIGEFLALVQPNGTTVVSAFSPEFPPQVGDVSYGVSANVVAMQELLGFGAAVHPCRSSPLS